jgi:uncharacterized Zn finger protein
MSRYDDYNDYGYFKPSKPIKTDQGLKARSKRGEFVEHWWARRWIEALERLLDPGRLSRGKSYARKGQVLSIKETKRGIEARVQGSRATPYKVTIEIDPLTTAQWSQVVETLADQAIFAAQLLAGEMPQDIEQVFAQAGVSLFPKKEAELKTGCSCPDPTNPCKHVAAVHYILGERFDQDPFLLFRLRGRSQEQLLEALQARGAEAGGPDEVESKVEPAAALNESLAHFWELGQPLNQFKTLIKPPVTELPVLKRLGQPPFVREELTEWLGPAYRAITAAALAAAFGAEGEQAEAESE